LDIRTAEQVSTHFLRSGLFENLVINEFIKQTYNNGEEPNLTFWSDSTGNEVDLLQYVDGKPRVHEIKSGATYSKASPNVPGCRELNLNSVLRFTTAIRTCRLRPENG